MSTLPKNTTILVVDDDLDARELLRFVLEESGAEVVVADSADAALRICRQHPPHAVISDIRLGRTDGYALIRAIRNSNKEYRGFTPVVAVTGFASPDDQEKAIAAGFNAYFSKPFDPEQILRVITRLLGSPSDLAA